MKERNLSEQLIDDGDDDDDDDELVTIHHSTIHYSLKKVPNPSILTLPGLCFFFNAAIVLYPS